MPRDYHEQLGGLCAWYRTEELLAELRYTGFPDAAFGKEVGWWQVGRGAWRLQHRSPPSPRGREAHRAGVHLQYTLTLPRRAVCVCTRRRRLRQDEEYGRMMDKKAVLSRIRFIVCTDHAHHTRQPRASDGEEKTRQNESKHFQRSDSHVGSTCGPPATSKSQSDASRTRRGRTLPFTSPPARIHDVRAARRSVTRVLARDDQSTSRACENRHFLLWHWPLAKAKHSPELRLGWSHVLDA